MNPIQTLEESKKNFFPKGWQDKIIKLYTDGASDVEVKALIYKWRGKFSNRLWDRWIIEEEEFGEVIKYGKLLSEAWWSRNGRINLKNKEFNYTGWYMNMKNRFGWSDRTETKTETTTSVVKLTKEERSARLNKLKSKL